MLFTPWPRNSNPQFAREPNWSKFATRTGLSQTLLSFRTPGASAHIALQD